MVSILDLITLMFQACVPRYETKRRRFFKTKFSFYDQGVDSFLANYMKTMEDKLNNLKKVFKIIMILSPGNVQVERGFSVNKYVSTVNMKPETVISHRLLYERVLKAHELCYVIEENSKTRNLTKEQREQLCEERYSAFKLMLIHVLKNGSHSEDYEDLLRCIFGNNAFYMFTI